jgi:hypothetical protein
VKPFLYEYFTIKFEEQRMIKQSRDYSVFSSIIAPTISEIDRHLELDGYESKNGLVTKQIIEKDARSFLCFHLHTPMLTDKEFAQIRDAFRGSQSVARQILIVEPALWRSLDEVIKEQSSKS